MNQEPYLPLDGEKGLSDWSKPVAIPTDVDMMLVAASSLGGKGNRQVPRQALPARPDQTNRRNRSVVSPGDIIGGPEKVTVTPAAAAPGAPHLSTPVGAAAAKPMLVDFTTNWTAGGHPPDRQHRRLSRAHHGCPGPDGDCATVSGDSKRFKEETTTPAKDRSRPDRTAHAVAVI